MLQFIDLLLHAEEVFEGLLSLLDDSASGKEMILLLEIAECHIISQIHIA